MGTMGRMGRTKLTRVVYAAAFAAFFCAPIVFPDHLAAQEQTAADGGGLVGPDGGPADPDAVAPPKLVFAVPVEDADLRVDGLLDDDAWRSAQWFSDFRQKEPVEGAEPTERTEIAFVFDEGNLYVGARMHAKDPSTVLAALSRRDDGSSRSDKLIVSLDTYRDLRTAYTFAVTAAGVRLDWHHPGDNEYQRDDTFNPIWQAETRIDSLGWTAEMRIPFSQLRFNDRDEQIWGINVNRWIPSNNEDIYWIAVPREESGWSSRFGELHGLNGVSSGRRMEISPYVATEAVITSAELVSDSDPFASRSDMRARVGADLKMGIGSNLTLDATINPDFGQVDGDPAVVNLSAFETVFDERRPFFTEGSQILSGNGRQGPNYYYSRRIGAPPHVYPSADYSDIPRVTTILGAGKLTGRLSSGLSVGALGALTSREHAPTYDVAGDSYGEASVEPMTGFGVVRLQQEVGQSASTFGLTATAVRRNFEGIADPTRLVLNRQAFSGGGDFLLRLGGGAYEINGHMGLSHVEGSPEAITRIQTANAHLFQRPDQDHVEFDSTRTSMTGGSGSIQVAKREGAWLWSGGVWADSPEWELNDVGLVRRADDIQSWANVTYRQTEPGSTFRNWSIGANGGMGWNFGGTRKDTRIGTNIRGTFNNYWRSGLRLNYFPAVQSDGLTRGGPLMGRSAFGAVSGYVANNFSSRTSWSLEGFWGTQNYGDDWSVEFGLQFQPNDRIRLAISPRVGRYANTRQYYGTIDRDGDATYGSRYMFATVNQSEISAEIRVNYSFSPDMSLELWAEPFAASGRFSTFGELPEAQSFDLREYGTDGTTIEEVYEPESGSRSYIVTDGAETFELPDADYNGVSFRSNLVLRWELRPGSTLFVVWQQNLSESRDPGADVRFGDLFGGFGAVGQNALAIKMNYWIPF
jgi:hypothetical protein